MFLKLYLLNNEFDTSLLPSVALSTVVSKSSCPCPCEAYRSSGRRETHWTNDHTGEYVITNWGKFDFKKKHATFRADSRVFFHQSIPCFYK